MLHIQHFVTIQIIYPLLGDKEECTQLIYFQCFMSYSALNWGYFFMSVDGSVKTRSKHVLNWII